MYIRHILPEPEQGVMPPNPLQGALTGIVNIAFHLALHQVRNGHQVELWCPSENGRHHERVVEGVTIRWLPLWKWARLPRYDLRWFLPLLLSNFYAPKADVLHVHNNPYLLVHRKSKTSILHFHSLLLRGSAVYDWFVRLAKRVICISDFIRDDVIRQVAYPRNRLITVYNGFELARFQQVQSTPARLAARLQFGIPEHALVVMFSGRVVPEKGLNVLLAAWKKTITQLQSLYESPLVLAVAGTTSLGLVVSENYDKNEFKVRWSHLSQYEQQITEEIADLPNGTTRFLGNLNRLQMPDFYAIGDLFVCPSIVLEGFGLVNIEAMAAGVPVIASAVGGIPEVVQPEFNGLLVPPDDPEALAQALIRLIQDEPLRRQMGANAQTFAQRFDWVKIAKQVEDVYKAL